jgi:hypothetical protein
MQRLLKNKFSKRGNLFKRKAPPKTKEPPQKVAKSAAGAEKASAKEAKSAVRAEKASIKQAKAAAVNSEKSSAKPVAKKANALPIRFPESLLEQHARTPEKDPLSLFVGNRQTLQAIDVIFSSTKQFVLYVRGPCGVGKTELIRVLARKYKYRLVTPGVNFFSQMWKMKRLVPTILNFDDVVSLDMEDSGLIKKLQQYLLEPTPCIVYISSSTDEMYKHLRFLTSDHKKSFVDIHVHVLKRPPFREVRYRFGTRVARVSNGDIRQAVILSNEKKGAAADIRYNAFDVTRKLLNSECRGLAEAFDVYEASNAFGSSMLFENYPQEFTSLDSMSKCAAAFSSMYLHKSFESALAAQLHLSHPHKSRNFRMSWTPFRKKKAFGVLEQRGLLFKINGPFNADAVTRHQYMALMRAKFKQLDLSARMRYKQDHDLTTAELRFMLGNSLKS